MSRRAEEGRWSRFLEQNSFLREYLWKYRKLVAIGLGALVLVDILEILPPIFLKRAVDSVVENQPRRQLLYIAGSYFAVAIVQGLCRYVWRMYLIRASMQSGRDLRQRYAGHLFGLGASFFDKRRIGDLMSHATTDVEAIRIAMGAGLLTLFDAILYLLTVPVAMFWLSPKLTLIALIPLPLIPWFVMRNEREIHSRFQKVQESFSRLAALAQEGLNGIRIVKAFAREDAQLDRIRKAGEEHIRLSMRLARVQTAFGPTLDFFMSMGLVLLLFIGGRHTIDGAVTIGTFVAFQRYIQKMIWPMAAVGLAITYYQRAIASSGRMKDILSVPTDVPEPAAPRLPPEHVPNGEWRTQGKIEFRNLSFRFPGTDRDVLSGINLAIEPGERVAFVGAIGAGKSALLALLPRLYPVQRGMLLIDGVDVNDWPVEELRRQVGYVSQDVFLFSASVVENVAFGLQEWVEAASADPRRIQHATELAAVHEDVAGLTEGYGTRLGERGVNLLGGQKQRLTIARAIAKHPAVLVLDDALSSVDVQTEEKILSSLRSRPRRNTEIIAAHRISTVKDADRIVVLEGGVVRQCGKHEELMTDRRGAYRRFYEQQRLKEDLEEYAEKIEQAAPATEERFV